MTEKMNIVRPLRLVGIALIGVVLFAAPLSAFSQSCALCYTQAASSGARMMAALRSGIWILVIPPMFMSIGITVVAYRKRNQFRDADRTDESDRIV